MGCRFKKFHNLSWVRRVQMSSLGWFCLSFNIHLPLRLPNTFGVQYGVSGPGGSDSAIKTIRVDRDPALRASIALRLILSYLASATHCPDIGAGWLRLSMGFNSRSTKFESVTGVPEGSLRRRNQGARWALPILWRPMGSKDSRVRKIKIQTRQKEPIP